MIVQNEHWNGQPRPASNKLKIKLIIQVDTLCHRLPNFIVKSARAGVTRVFIGLENINRVTSRRSGRPS